MFGTGLSSVGDFNTSETVQQNVSSTNGSIESLPEDVRITKDQFPMHQFLWRIGIIFAISGIIIVGSFIAMFGFSYTRRRRLFRRRRRRSTNLAFDNQLSVTQDEVDVRQTTRARAEDHVTPVHSSCSTSRWTRDENMPRPRSRSNSRSRSLSPGHVRSPRPQSPPIVVPRIPVGLEDDMLIQSDSGMSDLEKLDNARLAFKEDASKYAEYSSTKDRVNIEI